MTKVGVIIVTYNNIEMLVSLLRDLLGQTRKPDEIIVIDNASIDNTASTIKGSFPGIKYVRFDANTGSAGGYREGIRMAAENNDLIWVLDDDVSVDKNALAPLIEQMSELAKTKKVGAARSVGHALSAAKYPVRTGSFAWRGTLIPADVVKDIGLPRSEYFLYAEDVEYSMRMVRKGYKIYWVPNSKVIERRMADKLKLSALGLRTVTYSDAFRFYYANRNQMNVCLEYHAFWSLFKSLAHTVKVAILLMMAQTPNKALFMKAMIDGTLDGMRGKLGKDERYLPGKAY
jgi:GT2 family glycosyltransferase